MKIKAIQTTPLLVAYAQPYYWSQGVTRGAEVLLIEIRTENGFVGFGECLATPTAKGVQAFVEEAARHLLGQSNYARGTTDDALLSVPVSVSRKLQCTALWWAGAGRAGNGALGSSGKST